MRVIKHKAGFPERMVVSIPRDIQTRQTQHWATCCTWLCYKCPPSPVAEALLPSWIPCFHSVSRHLNSSMLNDLTILSWLPACKTRVMPAHFPKIIGKGKMLVNIIFNIIFTQICKWNFTNFTNEMKLKLFNYLQKLRKYLFSIQN